ncbi:MAG TPA: T9SS type A sorting domain-containing protein, partial [Adhaeribacter sp.]|nr:T9SS type A sorting domain-containing protein [Adhaeribacter sp.]
YAGQYVSYTNGVGSPGTELIPAMQGFFVRVLSGSPTFTFNNSNRVTTYQNPALYRQSQAETRPLVELSLQNTITQIKDKLFVYFENGATAGADAQFDAHKIYNMVNVPSFYSVAGSDELSINGLPVSIPGTVVPLGASVPQPGTYTIDAEQILNFNLNQPIYLEDLQAGITVNLRQQPTYTFTTSQYSISGRFVLRFGPAGVTGTAEAAQLAKVAVYPNPNQGVFTLSLPAQSLANVEATLYNAIGQRVWSKTFRTNGASMQETINLEKLAKGVYSLRLETASGPVLKKIVIE